DAKGLLEVHGAAEIAGRFRLDGTYRGDGAFDAAEAEIHGRAQFGGPVRVDRVLTVTGRLDAPRVEAGTVVVRGALQIPGNLSATLLDATLRGPSSIEHLSADTIRIAREAVPMQSMMPTPLRHLTRQWLGRGGAELSVLRIDGRSVEIEGVHVGYLRAETITVGADCRIDRYDGRILRAHSS
ncbi:YhbE, partial [mine drainage metagenome]